PDGQRLLFVSNREVAYGTGDIWSVSISAPEDLKKVFSEETEWRAQPQVAPDGRRVLFSSYHGRQWQQLWLTTIQGASPFPLTFGEFDRTQARFSPDGNHVGYISNEEGNTSLWVQEVVGGGRIHADAADWRRAVAGFSRARLRDCRATRPRHGRKQHDDDLAQAAALASSIRPLRQRGPACAHELWWALSEHFSESDRTGTCRALGCHLQPNRQQGGTHSRHRAVQSPAVA